VLGADDEDIERKAEAAERLVESRSLIQSVGRRRGDDEQVDIAVAGHRSVGRGAEEDDPVWPGDTQQAADDFPDQAVVNAHQSHDIGFPRPKAALGGIVICRRSQL